MIHALLLAAFAAGAIQAADAAPPKVLVDVAAADMAPERLLPAPPTDGTPRAAIELQQVRAVTEAATPDRLAQARWDGEHEDPTLFAPTLGPAYDLDKLPATRALLRLVWGDAEASATAAKKAFPRRRPGAVDATIKRCETKDKPLTSYPSGHAMIGYSLGMTLALALPEHAPQILARASDYAYSRVVCGAHYASDTAASEALAAVLVTRLSTNLDFQAKLDAARRELAGKF